MKRREFLSECGWVAAGGALATTMAAPASGDTRLRIGQIGTTGAHASGKMKAMLGLPELWEVVGLVEPVPAHRENPVTAATWEGLPLLTEEELLGRSDLRAVVVETSIGDAPAAALRAIRAGKHVHLEKPGGFDHAEFKAMRLEAEQRGLVVQMGYMLRYNPAFQLLFRAVREGWLGELTEVDAYIGKLGDPATRAFLAELPGGGMFELGCHLIDTVLTLLGPPESVTAFATPSRDDGVEDNQMAVFRYPRATAVVRCNFADPFGSQRRRISVTGTGGTLEIAPMESRTVKLSLSRAQGGHAKGTRTFLHGEPEGRYDGEFIDLFHVLSGEKAFAWDAAHDIAVHEAILRASGAWRGDR